MAGQYVPADAAFLGTHQLKFGVDFEREAFHQQSMRHPYEVLGSTARWSAMSPSIGSPFEDRKNFEGAQYVQDHWTPAEGLSLEGGLRTEWNEIVRALEVAPRLAGRLGSTFSGGHEILAGWGIYYDAINLNLVAQQQDQVSLSTFYLPGGVVQGPVETQFEVYDQYLKVPYSQNASATVERKLPRQYYLKAGYTRRRGDRGFVFCPTAPRDRGQSRFPRHLLLDNSRRERYDAADLSLRHTFAGKFEWFAGYTRSSARSNAAVDYSLENPIFGAQGAGPAPWDAPNLLHTWGWAPLPNAILPQSLDSLRTILPWPTWWNIAPVFPSASWTSKTLWWEHPTRCASPIISTSTSVWSGVLQPFIIYGPGVSVSTISPTTPIPMW